MIGNFIGDYIKGQDYNKYPALIKKGILLHRRIDSYTDKHKIICQSKNYFILRYKKYSGIIIDILYDHFLANNWDKFAAQPLDDFKENVFDCLKRNYSVLPERVQFFIPSFIKNDWISVYKSVEGIIAVLNRMSMRTTLPDESEFAREVLRKYYVQLQSEFLIFFPEIIKYVVKKHGVNILLKDNAILE
ncbi:Acyl carrier protein phosphodiesterase [subsurface metagenome]